MATRINVLFVCQHGSAKSVIAAEHFRRMAAARGLSVESSSSGLDPYDEIPPAVLAGLGAESIDASTTVPRQVTSEVLASASHVVSLGCELPEFADAGKSEIWDDIPAVSDGYAPARDAIVSRLEELLKRMADA